MNVRKVDASVTLKAGAKKALVLDGNGYPTGEVASVFVYPDKTTTPPSPRAVSNSAPPVETTAVIWVLLFRVKLLVVFMR